MAPKSIWRPTKWENDRYVVNRSGKRYKVEDLWQDTTTTVTSFAEVETRGVFKITQQETTKIWPVQVKVSLDLISRDGHWYIECHCNGASFYARVKYMQTAEDLAEQAARFMAAKANEFMPRERKSR